jgi:hypothetical protein
VQAEACHRADHAFTTDGRSFNGPTVIQNHKKRDHSAQGEGHVFDLVPRVENERALLHRTERQLIFQKFDGSSRLLTSSVQGTGIRTLLG